MLEEILNKYEDSEFMKADGLDEAIIGVYDGKLVYSESKCIEVLSRDMGEDAAEYFHFNVECAYMGDNTPIFIDDSFEKSYMSFEDCLREEFLINTQGYPKEYHELFAKKYQRAKERFELEKAIL